MQTANDLRDLLKRIDRRSYPAYKDTRGAYQFPGYVLSIDHVQGDPFAAPSRLSIHVQGRRAAFPRDLYQVPCRRVAIQDELTRRFARQAARLSFQAKGSGQSGLIAVSRCGQEVLERTACRLDPASGDLLLRLEVGFPANGRTINARELEKILFGFLPRCVQASLFYREADAEGLWAAADGLVYQQFADECERFLLDGAPADIQYAVVGVDFGGTKSAHSFTLTGFTRGFRQVVVLDEYYHNNIKQGRLSPAQVEAAFVDFVRRAKARFRVYEACCDSAEQTLIEGLTIAAARARLGIEIRDAIKRPINDRIAFYNSLIAQDRFRILRHCTAHIRAFAEAVYDPNERVRDIRLDDGTTDIDSLDSTEYTTERIQDDILYLGR